MISRHVDIWAILLLLFAFALFTRTNEAVVRMARTRMSIYQGLQPTEVRISPFRLNRFGQAPVRHAPGPCRLI